MDGMNDPQTLNALDQVMDASEAFTAAARELQEQALVEVTGGEVTLSYVRLLLLISRPGERFKVKDVADFLGVTNAAASRSIDRLVQQDLVDRRATPEDRRAVDLTLTPLAEELLARFKEVRNQELLRLLGDYPADKARRAAELLTELSALLEDAETPYAAEVEPAAAPLPATGSA
jgi:DNA-binding MarR family transcriptional regulator